jgi:autotransporter adhesin
MCRKYDFNKLRQEYEKEINKKPDGNLNGDIEAKVNKNKQDITDINGKVDINTAAIKENKEGIADNKAAIAETNEKVATNTAAIKENKEGIADNKAAIAETNEKVATNTAAIKENKEGIADNKAAIAETNKKVDKNTDDIAETKENVADNTKRISENTNRLNLLDGAASKITEQETRLNAMDQRMDYMDNRIGEVQTEARSGIASAMALSAMRFDSRPGKVSLTFGSGGFMGHTSLAGGLGYTSESSNVRVNVGIAHSLNNGSTAWNAGASFTFN